MTNAKIKGSPHETASYVADMLDELCELSMGLADPLLRGLLELSVKAARVRAAETDPQDKVTPQANENCKPRRC